MIKDDSLNVFHRNVTNNISSFCSMLLLQTNNQTTKRRKNLHNFSCHSSHTKPSCSASTSTGAQVSHCTTRHKHQIQIQTPKEHNYLFIYFQKKIFRVLHLQTTNTQSKKCKFKQFKEFHYTSLQIAIKTPILNFIDPPKQKIRTLHSSIYIQHSFNYTNNKKTY